MDEDLDRVISNLRVPARGRLDRATNAWRAAAKVAAQAISRARATARGIISIVADLLKVAFGLAVALGFAAFGWSILVGLGERLAPQRYAAEVGYYRGTDIAWDLWGDFKSLDDCRSAAIFRYNFYVEQNDRAYTWSCLLKNARGGYESRHR